jgi:competence protein ComEA
VVSPRQILSLLVVLCVGILIGVGGTVLGGRAQPAPIVIEPAPPTPIPTQPAAWRVHVTGAVMAPGVYEVPPQSIALEAIRAAGGFAADAAEASVNQALPLTNGGQVWVPTRDEMSGPVVRDQLPTAPGAPATRLNLNRATAAELQGLPGIGPSTAANIIAHRDAHGPFASIEAIMDVPGIGPAKFEQIAALIMVDP